MADTLDTKTFRLALGRFATGVTVITTRDAQGRPIGVTANSFNSVSLNPPMVLWSLARSSNSMPAFMEAERFAVHILSAGQEELSNRFASRGGDKFDGMELDPRELPLIDGCTARFDCKTAYRYDGGDHVIFVGEVKDYVSCDLAPLLYHGGSYAEARPLWRGEWDGIDAVEGRVAANSLLNLVAQAYVQLTRPLHGWLAEQGLEQPLYLVLSIASNLDRPARAEIARRVAGAGYADAEAAMDRLVKEGRLAEDANGVLTLTPEGRAAFVQVLSNLQAFEDDLAACFSRGEVADLKAMLGRIVERTMQGIPTLLA
jgi:3-hydroxy-9,10-secoandrosta-1,3,5(10)-triene-9,17-dione monooxygenase reductase component